MAENQYYTEEQLAQRKAFEQEFFNDTSNYDIGNESSKHKESLKELQKPPLGVITPVMYTAPDYNRDNYIKLMYDYIRRTEYLNYGELTSNKLYFRQTEDHLNYFHPDFIKVFNMFLNGYQMENLEIVKGMSSPHTNRPNAHTIGMAIDIKVNSTTQRNHIMNCAWSIGIPNIVQAGDGSADVHVHLDICPKEKFMYDGIYYEGPWSLSRFT